MKNLSCITCVFLSPAAGDEKAAACAAHPVHVPVADPAAHVCGEHPGFTHAVHLANLARKPADPTAPYDCGCVRFGHPDGVDHVHFVSDAGRNVCALKACGDCRGSGKKD